MTPEAYKAAWERFVEACNAENINHFLAETCETDWLAHCHYFNLVAELEFIERNHLNSILVAGKFAYPLWALESSELFGFIPLVEAYKGLFDDCTNRGVSYDPPEKLVHLMSRQVIRSRLDLPALTQREINAFYAQPQPRALLPKLSCYPRQESTSEASPADYLQICEFLKEHYPDVVAYWMAVLTKAESQGYVVLRNVGGHSTALHIVDSTVAYFLPEKWINIDHRAAVLDLLTEKQITKSSWLLKW